MKRSATSSDHGTALLLIDVINDLDFAEADQLLQFAVPMARRIHALKVRAEHSGVPVIYVNDNFGQWRSDFRAQVEHCLNPESKGREIADLLRPDANDYFVLKPKHSGFYSTSLDVLLKHLGARTLILTGIATNICLLFTANDAYMRDYRILVPNDCSAANSLEDHLYALQQMRFALKADTRPSDEIEFSLL